MLTSPVPPVGEPAHFEAMFAESDDPWEFRSRWYERRKRALTLACLPSERYARGFEPGCANAELSASLATRCDRLLVSDGIDKAVMLAGQRLQGLPHVTVRKAWMPRDWPDEKFDLIVLSEFLFYLTPDAVEQIALNARDTLLPGGVVLACHWRRPIAGCVVSGDAAHLILQRVLGLPNHCSVVEPDLRLDVWSDAPGVADKEGLS